MNYDLQKFGERFTFIFIIYSIIIFIHGFETKFFVVC